MAPRVEEDDSDDDVPLAGRGKKEVSTPAKKETPTAAKKETSTPKAKKAASPAVAVKKKTPPGKAAVKKEKASPAAQTKAKTAIKKEKPAPAEGVKVKLERKEYDLPGQKRDPPDEKDGMRLFYVSLRRQKPSSEMAEAWLMEQGLLPAPEADKAYKRMLIRKGRSMPDTKVKREKAGGPGSSGGARKSVGKSPGAGKASPGSKGAKSAGKKKKQPPGKSGGGKAKPTAKRKAADLDDDDEEEDIPLAKRGGGGGGFQIPKTEAGSTPSKKNERLAIKEEIGQ
mmetsp:Transcript_44650/g.71664  ORF Transcript_44650/g.71664 Transcript_44650/m.71664 type:complete len:283 (+) Transcript_44650:222-1070(+)